MTIAWFVSAGFILALIPDLTFVRSRFSFARSKTDELSDQIEALCISACVTPTDPILANSIVQGRYAEKHVPKVRSLRFSLAGVPV